MFEGEQVPPKVCELQYQHDLFRIGENDIRVDCENFTMLRGCDVHVLTIVYDVKGRRRTIEVFLYVSPVM